MFAALGLRHVEKKRVGDRIHDGGIGTGPATVIQKVAEVFLMPIKRPRIRLGFPLVIEPGTGPEGIAALILRHIENKRPRTEHGFVPVTNAC